MSRIEFRFENKNNNDKSILTLYALPIHAMR